MPKKVEEALRKEAVKKFREIKDPEARKEKEDSFIYGTMTNMAKRGEIRWNPRNRRGKKG